ncbi:hypothetical protein B484DRAFT_444440, partial [Ochromonadaceae sp. CCMP2298]
VQRAYNAHTNSIEAFGYLSTAVLLTLHTKGDSAELTLCCNAFLALRVAYVLIYVLAFNPALSLVRSVCFGAALGVLLKIFSMGAGELSLAKLM